MIRKRNRVPREKYQRFPTPAEQVVELQDELEHVPLPSATNRTETDKIVQELLGEGDVDPALKIKGMPPNYGNDVLPHVISFTGLISTISKVYRPSDNALQASWENAKYMLNDCSIMECLEQRTRSTALLNWHLEPEDETDPKQKALAEELTSIIEETPRFMQYRESLLRALWFGKYANKMRYRWKTVQGKQRICIDKWEPVHGDKLVFRYDSGTGDYDPDQIGIRVGAGFHSLMARSWQQERLSQIQLADIGLAYFLKPWERQLLAIHKHCTEDGEWEDVESAGRIHGVGIRHRIYWCWYQMQEALAWLMEFLERSAFGMEIWYYPWGDKTARDRMYTAAQDRIGQGRNIILVPRPVGEASQAYGVERIEPAMAGADILADKVIKELFGHRIKRYILGQTLTTESAGTGLGSNLASVHLDTYLQIVRYDATNLEETMTTELVTPLKRFNYPWARDLPIRFKIDTEAQDVDGKLAAWERAWNMGCRLKESDVMELIAAATPGEEDVVLLNPTIDQQKRLTAQHEQMMQQQMQQQAAGSTPAQPQGPQPPPAEVVDPNQPFQPGQTEMYRTVGQSVHGGGWKTVGGGAHAFIGSDGTIKAACPGLKGEDVDEIGETESDEHQDMREHRQDVAKSKGIEGNEISNAGVKALEKAPTAPPVGQPQTVTINGRQFHVKRSGSGWLWTVDPSIGWTAASDATAAAIEKAAGGAGKAEVAPEAQIEAKKAREAQRRRQVALEARHAARQQRTQALVDTANEYGVAPDDLNDALDYVLEENQKETRNREAAKAQARQLTGFSAGDIARLENAGHDYASGNKVPGRAGEILRHWDQFAQEVASEHPDLGWGERVNSSQALWDLIKEGARHVPSRNDPDILRQAANIALAHRGDVGGAYEFEEAGAVPFSKRGLIERYAEWYARRKSAEGQTSMFKESEHPRDDASGEFVEKGGESKSAGDAPKTESLPGQMHLFGGETAKGKPAPKPAAIPPPEKKARQESMFHGLGDLLGQGDLFNADYKDEAKETPKQSGMTEPLPERTADTMSDAIAMSSPSGSMSKQAHDQAVKKLSVALFGDKGLAKPSGPEQRPESELLRTQAKQLRELAKRGMKPRAYVKKADELERKADLLDTPDADKLPDRPSASNIARIARNTQQKQGSQRQGDMEYRVEEDGTVTANHAITGRDIGTIDLHTGNIIPSRDKWKARLEELRNTLESNAAKAIGSEQLARLKDYPVRNAKEIARLESKDKLPGGPADNMPDTAFDPKQLAKGRKEESEHTNDPEVAGEIAKDHLVTGKKYAADEGPPSNGIGGVATTTGVDAPDPDFSPEDLASLDGVLAKKSGIAELKDRRSGDKYRYTASEGGISVEKTRTNWSNSTLAGDPAVLDLFKLAFRERGWCCPNYQRAQV
jgi:phage gp29-like protein